MCKFQRKFGMKKHKKKSKVHPSFAKKLGMFGFKK